MGSQYVLNDVIAFDFYLGGGVQYSKELLETEVNQISEEMD